MWHWAETVKHYLNVTKVKLRGTGGWLAFIIFAVAPGAAMPSVRAFYPPSLGKGSKAACPLRAFLHCEPPPGAVLVQPSLQVMVVILAIAKDHAQPRNLFRTNLSEQGEGRRAISQGRTRAQHNEHQPDRIDAHRACAPCDFLPSVIPACLAADFRRLARLAVDTGRTRGWRTPGLAPYARPELVDDLGPGALIAPLRNVFIDRTLGE